MKIDFEKCFKICYNIFMQEIISKNNELIKNVCKLKEKKYRDLENKILLEGYKVFLEAEKCGLKVERIITTKKNLEILNFKKYNNKLIITNDEICKKLSNNVTSQNFFAVVEKPKNNGSGSNFLILDNIQDPQNLGAIIRSSVATNILDIYCINCVDEYNDKVIRASMGNIFKVNINHISIEDLDKVCENSIVYSANMNGKNLFKLEKPKNKFGLILGNEGNGVSSEVEKFANKIISIPMQNNVESLNVAVSMSIIAYYLTN